jgi:hypothetical protein
VDGAAKAFTPATLLSDEETTFLSTRVVTAERLHNGYQGDVTLRTALGSSST